jgi:hypothetical protein
MKDSEILIEAKRRLAGKDGSYEYICNEIRWSFGGDYSGQRDKLIEWIEQMLDGEHTYYGWLSKNNHPCTDKATRAGQLAWLDWMIDYCKKEEA